MSGAFRSHDCSGIGDDEKALNTFKRSFAYNVHLQSSVPFALERLRRGRRRLLLGNQQTLRS